MQLKTHTHYFERIWHKNNEKEKQKLSCQIPTLNIGCRGGASTRSCCRSPTHPTSTSSTCHIFTSLNLSISHEQPTSSPRLIKNSNPFSHIYLWRFCNLLPWSSISPTFPKEQRNHRNYENHWDYQSENLLHLLPAIFKADFEETVEKTLLRLRIQRISIQISPNSNLIAFSKFSYL